MVVIVPYDFQEVINHGMDDCPNNTKADLAVRNVLGRMKLIRELHCLHITKEASNAQCNAINGEVTMYSFQG